MALGGIAPALRGGALSVRSALAAALLVLGLAGATHAEPGAETAAVAKARAHFERGHTAYQAGRLKEAAAEFARAHELAPSPELEFNLARVYERMGEAEPAMRHYRTYLTGDGVAPGERAQIEERIRALEALVARQQAQVKAPPPSSDALTAEARAFFERGLALFRRKQYAAALEAFAAARRFVPLPELAYNLALTSERLGRSGEAVDHYRAYLRESRHPEDEESVRTRIKALLLPRSASAKSGR